MATDAAGDDVLTILPSVSNSGAQRAGNNYNNLEKSKVARRRGAAAATTQQLWHLAGALVHRAEEANIPFG